MDTTTANDNKIEQKQVPKKEEKKAGKPEPKNLQVNLVLSLKEEAELKPLLHLNRKSQLILIQSL